jgi:protein-tyrosine phosphatase
MSPSAVDTDGSTRGDVGELRDEGCRRGRLPSVIDLHAHVLPGIDDGPDSLESALELLRELVADGVTTVAATPHVRDDYPTTPEQIATTLAALRRAAHAELLEIEILPGAELAVDRIRFALQDENLPAFTLAGNPGYLLVEFPYHGWPLDLADVVDALVRGGVRPVLAHPERNGIVQESPERIAPLVAKGALVQITASSFVGQAGARARRTAFYLLEKRLVHLVGSDSHGAGIRRVGLSAVRGQVDGVLADWLTMTLPGAIVRDTVLPPRPRTRHGRLRWATQRLVRRTASRRR